MTNVQNNVKYGKFTVEELFDVKGTKSTDAGKVHFVGKQDGDAQFIGRTNANYGLQGYVNSEDFAFEPNKANTISVSQVGTITAQYRDFPYYTSQNITKLSADFLNRQIGLYICSAINQWLRGAQFEGYHTLKMADLKKQQLILPVTSSGTPDFEYMEERIRELEEERIRELEAYLKVTGLSDATLTKADQDALDKMNMGGVKQAKFKVGSLFDIHPTKAYKMTNRLLMDSEGTIPVLTNTSANNGIGGYSKLKPTEEQPIITFSDTTTGGDTLFIQTRPFIGYSHVQGMYPITEHKWTVKEMLYFVSSLRQAAGDGWSYANKFTRDKVSKIDMLLPVTSSGDIDFDFMETYITAIEKQSICGVIKYKDKMIQTTKDVVNAN